MELRIDLEKQGCDNEKIEKIIKQRIDEEKSMLAAKAEEINEHGGSEEDRNCLQGKKDMMNIVFKDAVGIKEKRKRILKEEPELKQIAHSEIELSEELENRLVGFEVVPDKRRKGAFPNLACVKRHKEEGDCRDNNQEFGMDCGREFWKDKTRHQEQNIMEKLELFEDRYENRFPQAKLEADFKMKLSLAEQRKRGRQEEDKKKELGCQKERNMNEEREDNKLLRVTGSEGAIGGATNDQLKHKTTKLEKQHATVRERDGGRKENKEQEIRTQCKNDLDRNYKRKVRDVSKIGEEENRDNKQKKARASSQVVISKGREYSDELSTRNSTILSHLASGKIQKDNNCSDREIELGRDTERDCRNTMRPHVEQPTLELELFEERMTKRKMEKDFKNESEKRRRRRQEQEWIKDMEKQKQRERMDENQMERELLRRKGGRGEVDATRNDHLKYKTRELEKARRKRMCRETGTT
ncbi:hypothetical protein E2562_033820 [Oryza meyeriana var. granulata]|uniref:Uncharacterized protein n=1 Tax=Oryza meyeriana var. granulata TaxID=110450 RepID=A0A6G1F168_9ORYZ|nr:hypothetical protein E2562_033820 [Oryza meyeriana var. granulata]